MFPIYQPHKLILMKNYFYLVMIMVLFVYGCTPTTTIVDTSCPRYRSEEFSRDDISRGGIAVMPVLGAEENEPYRRPMGDVLKRHMSEAFGSEQVMHPQDVIKILNEHDMMEVYLNVLVNYKNTGIISDDLVRDIGNLLRVEYLLYTRLLARRELEYVNTGYISDLVNMEKLVAQSEVWDVNTGDIVWQGNGGVAANRQHSRPDKVELTAKSLTGIIGKEHRKGPCEDPEEIVKSAREATTATYIAISGAAILIILFFSSLN